MFIVNLFHAAKRWKFCPRILGVLGTERIASFSMFSIKKLLIVHKHAWYCDKRNHGNPTWRKENEMHWRNKDIELPADKRKATVIMDTTDYNNKINALINSDTYELCKVDLERQTKILRATNWNEKSVTIFSYFCVLIGISMN